VANTEKSKLRWVKLGLIFFAFLVFSIGLGYYLQSLLAHYHVPVNIPAWLAFLIIIGILGVINLSAIPIPFGVSIMLVAAQHWNPVLVALFGSIGASLGEFSSYFFGYLGKKVSLNDNIRGYKMIKDWIDKYGMWAIAFLSFQPVIPFEIGGFVAGVAKMPIKKFLPAILIGKFPKYLILIFLGGAVIHFWEHFHIR
jgi:uncharacterized membrane protein YdjX (TVP38/TMEM64 family)